MATNYPPHRMSPADEVYADIKIREAERHMAYLRDLIGRNPVHDRLIPVPDPQTPNQEEE